MSDAPELEERIKQIIRTIAGTYWIASDPTSGEGPLPQTVMDVTTHLPAPLRAALIADGKDPDATWFVYWDINPNDNRLVRALVHIPPTLLADPEDVAKGCAAHEAGHLAITRKHRVVPEEILELPGFAAILAATEERATDHVVEVRFPGAGDWLREARETNVQESLAMPEVAQSNLGLPRYLQLCNAITFEPYSFPTEHCCPEVQAVFEQIRADVAELEQTLPHEHASEREVRAAAIERYRIAYCRIWPKVQPLVQADLHDEIEKRLAEQQGRDGTDAPHEPNDGDATPGGTEGSDTVATDASYSQFSNCLNAQKAGPAVCGSL